LIEENHRQGIVVGTFGIGFSFLICLLELMLVKIFLESAIQVWKLKKKDSEMMVSTPLTTS
jgi:hypothetical protein